ncbi:hypothetical protein B0H17DRAFT_1221100 [Mycena rosella]|uniref:Uncharacterized protein n=1 Tax=Mycena rosella TaxID=1033263 RepID=A0AAD7B681_MYCRO|nr:hypothetical protein B0H17DRAFT_1221100 [Mycena rosella]
MLYQQPHAQITLPSESGCTKKPHSDRHPQTRPATPGPGTVALTTLEHNWAALTTLEYDQAALTMHIHGHAARSRRIRTPQHDRILGLDLVLWGTAIVRCRLHRNP